MEAGQGCNVVILSGEAGLKFVKSGKTIKKQNTEGCILETEWKCMMMNPVKGMTTRGVEHEWLNCVSRAHDCRDGADKGSGAEACIQKAQFASVSRPEKNGGSRNRWEERHNLKACLRLADLLVLISLHFYG